MSITIQKAPADLGLTNYEALPFLAPSALTSVVTDDAYLTEVQLWPATSLASGTVGLIIQDGQTPPVFALSVNLLAGQGISYQFDRRTMKNGIFVQADQANAVSVFLRYAKH